MRCMLGQGHESQKHCQHWVMHSSGLVFVAILYLRLYAAGWAELLKFFLNRFTTEAVRSADRGVP